MTEVTVTKKAKPIPPQEIEKWRKDLKNSKNKPYEYFDDTVINDKIIEQYIDSTHHIKVYMGYNPNAKKKDQYILFMLQAVGVVVPQGYSNNYNEIVQYNPEDQSWNKCDKATLDQYTESWKEFCDANKMDYIRAFIIPNSDIKTLDIATVYLSFGMDEKAKVKMVLGNKSTKSVMVVNGDEPIYVDTCMPCPKVCGTNE